MPIHVTSLPTVNMYQAEIGSNIAQHRLFSPYEVIIYVNSVKSWPKEKLGQVKIGSNIAHNHIFSR